jgi:hypothetical protein
LEELWVHNGDDPFSNEKFHKAKNSRFFYRNKPIGGFWLSEYTPQEEFLSAWHRWCYDACPHIKKNNYFYKLDYSRARIFTINNKEDFDYLISRFPILYSNLLDGIELECINFEEVQKKWSGLFLTNKGLIENNHNLAAWDVPSLVIFDPSIIKAGELI